MRALILLCLLLAAAIAQEDDSLLCEIDLLSDDQVLEDPSSRLFVETESLPLTTKFEDPELQQRYQIRIQTARFQLHAFNANNQTVGTVLGYSDLAQAGCIVLGVGESPDCVGLLGCDGFVQGVVKTLQQFPQTAHHFAFNFTFLVIDPETTVTRGWIWKTQEKVAASVSATSDPQVLVWVPSDALRAAAFPASVSNDDDTWKMWVYILGSVLGTLVLLILFYIFWLARRESLEEQHHHHGGNSATEEEKRPLMPPSPPKYDIKGEYSSQLKKRSLGQPVHALVRMESSGV